ncbi:MAG TPA: hypothetical protein VJL35_07715, partial [Gemmatimonadaceae bacterium]|nr:hypothetical protein [Gemmatimonadaceae bacterium]
RSSLRRVCAAMSMLFVMAGIFQVVAPPPSAASVIASDHGARPVLQSLPSRAVRQHGCTSGSFNPVGGFDPPLPSLLPEYQCGTRFHKVSLNVTRHVPDIFSAAFVHDPTGPPGSRLT